VNFLAYDMDGEPLTRIHGFPLRVHDAGTYDEKCRMVDAHRVRRQEHPWILGMEGMSNTGERQLQSVIDDPRTRSRFQGKIRRYRLGHCEEVGVAKVEISTDGETLGMPARFSATHTVAVWAFWRYVC